MESVAENKVKLLCMNRKMRRNSGTQSVWMVPSKKFGTKIKTTTEKVYSAPLLSLI